MEDKLICLKCNRELEVAIVNLEYQDTKVSYEFPRCPVCKQIYIPEEIIESKMKEFEITLENK